MTDNYISFYRVVVEFSYKFPARKLRTHIQDGESREDAS